MAIWVKICGVTRLEDALAAIDCGADAIGINFWPQSKRYCDPEQARGIVACLPRDALVYGVFCDATREQIETVIRDVGIGGVQLHGSEPESAADGWDVPVIRAVFATSREAVTTALEKGVRPLFRILIDNAAGGGSGRAVDPAMLDGLALGEAIVAGGLTPKNVAATVARLRPFGVDTAGGVESEPGIKDARKIADFITQARKAAAAD